MSSTPNPEETRKEWPGWTWGEFSRYLEDILPPIVPVPGSLLQSRQETIDKAWRTPLSVSGAYVEFIFSVKEWAGDESFLAAQRWMDSMSKKVEPAGSFVIQGESMPQLIIPGVFQVAIVASSGGQPVINVVAVSNPTGTALAAANAVKKAWETANATPSLAGPMGNLGSQYVMQKYRAMDIGTANGAIAEVASTAAGRRAGTANLATNGACALITWNGGTRSRSSRGRLYYGPLQETQIQADGRTFSPESTSTHFDFFRSTLSAEGYPLVIASRKEAKAYAVTSHTVQTIIATQRRRIR